MEWPLGFVQRTKNPAELLQGAYGIFKVTGPAGEVNRYECKAGYSIASITNLSTVEPTGDGFFLVEKIGEPITSGAMLENTLQTARHKTAGR